MSSTPLNTRDPRSPIPVHGRLLRWMALAALLLSCAKGATRPYAPNAVLHYPAWIAALGDQLLVVNLDQDLAYDHGAVVAIATGDGTISGGVAVPNMAGQILLVDAATAGACAANLNKPDGTSGPYALPFALVAGRFEDALYVVPLSGEVPPFGGVQRIALHPFSASVPFGVGFSCGPDKKPRAWVSYQSGQNDAGYVAQVDLSSPPGADGSVVQVSVGNGPPRSFAYDAARDRLYFTGRENSLSAPVRWIEVGNGCLSFDNGVQDERKGGCHVDAGFDLSLQFRGAEPNQLALSSAEFPCTAGGFTGNCRRAYLSVRMYDADLANFQGNRPSGDVGGKLMVLELPEGGLGRPEPQVVTELDIGMIAGDVLAIPRSAGQHDLVAVTAVDDDLLWIYDDDSGAMVKVFGRDSRGVPMLGHEISGITSQDQGGGVVRLFVTSYQDGWVSAVDVPLDLPGTAYVVRQGSDPTDATQPFRRWGVTP